MKYWRIWQWAAGMCAAFWLSALLPATASPPVRIAVVPGGGSGQEQSAVDQISSGLDGNSNIVLSTVNPDWYVVCNIVEQTDIVSGSSKVNGTVLIKTTDGQVIKTVSVQTNKQDFSTQPGAPLNKALVESGVREVIAGMAERALGPIQDAVTVEIATRDAIIQAQSLSDQDRYDEAMALLQPISPDTPHFRAVRSLIGMYAMEKEALRLVTDAEVLAKKGKYVQAIQQLTAVNAKSKRYALAKQRIVTYRAALARLARIKSAAAHRTTAKPGAPDLRLQALESQKRALEAQKKALEDQEAVIKSQRTK